MSYNPGIAYVGPDGATRSLTNELTARDGTPSRPYEFVTGWKDAGNVSGHNPDSNGITHGVDIFTGNLRWTADHLAARGRAGDPRVLYVIYAGQLANARTGWQFAGEGWGHWDHVHLSVWDGYFGGPCTLPASIYNDTSSWGVVPITGQSATITPITEEGFLMALSDADQIEVRDNLRKLVGMTADVQGKVADIGTASGTKSLRQFVADGTRAAQTAAAQTADIRRGGQGISLRQEVADIKTSVTKSEPVIVAIAEAVVTAPDVDGA